MGNILIQVFSDFHLRMILNCLEGNDTFHTFLYMNKRKKNK